MPTSASVPSAGNGMNLTTNGVLIVAAKLTAQAVKDLLNACSVPGDLHKQPFQGIVSFYMLSPDAVKAHHQDIMDLLLELPDQFLLTKGGGWSFLQAPFDNQ